MTAAVALPPPPGPGGARRRVSDLLYTRRGLLLLALLAPPLLWFGVIYLGSLLALLANAFFGLDDFTGQVVREFTLKNFVELADPANLDVARRSITMAIAGDPLAVDGVGRAGKRRGTQRQLIDAPAAVRQPRAIAP